MSILQSLKSEYESLLNKERELILISNKTLEQYQERKEASERLFELNRLIVNEENKLQAIDVGGSITAINDKIGNTFECPDFRQIKTEYYAFDEDDILDKEKPKYIPSMNKDQLSSRGYVFDSIKVDSDSYLIAVNGFWYKKPKSKYNINQEVEKPKENFFALVTLEQLVLTSQYYHTLAKALEIKKVNDTNERNRQYFIDKPYDTRKWYYDQKNFYFSLPKKVQYKYTKGEWDNLTVEEKQEIYVPVKRVGVKRIESKLDSNEMWTSLHKMYEDFINPLATQPKERVANNEVWSYWVVFREMMRWKINDLIVRKEGDSEIRKVAIETAFGDSNTIDDLVETHGILVKRQNGAKISENEIDQIRSKWDAINDVIGDLRGQAKNFGLKISHTQGTYVYASKASGMFVPQLKAIAVSNKWGDSMFGYIMAHEVAHWLDIMLGKKNNRICETDNYESKAGSVANILKINMNVKTDSKYTNATKECFARAIEQYFAIITTGDGAFHEYNEGKLYFEANDYVNKDVFYNKLKPAIEIFLSDIRWFFEEFSLSLYKQKIMAYKMHEYEGIDLTSVEIPLDKQEKLVELFGGKNFDAQEFYTELYEVSKGFTIEDEEALEFDDLLYKIVKAYEKKVPLPEIEPIETPPEPTPVVVEEIVEKNIPPTKEEIQEAIELLSELEPSEETNDAIELLRELI